MARERKWDAVAPQPIIADGTSEGLILTDAANLFHVKQVVILSSSGTSKDNFVINKIESPNKIYVGPVKGKITERSDVSNYLFTDSPTIQACEQNRPTIATNEIDRAVYQEEPAMALRVLSVDEFGDPVTPPLESTQQAQLDALTAICAKLEAQNTGTARDTKIADEVISALKAVIATSPTNIALGQPVLPIAQATILGITRTAAATGSEAEIITYGELSDTSFTWLAGTPLFLSANGTITDIAPTTGVLTRLGHSMGPGRIFIDIQEPIKLP